MDRKTFYTGWIFMYDCTIYGSAKYKAISTHSFECLDGSEIEGLVEDINIGDDDIDESIVEKIAGYCISRGAKFAILNRGEEE